MSRKHIVADAGGIILVILLWLPAIFSESLWWLVIALVGSLMIIVIAGYFAGRSRR
jgi:type IV secretory pathway TrbD component